jgi:hypothetical protein
LLRPEGMYQQSLQTTNSAGMTHRQLCSTHAHLLCLVQPRS